MENKANTQNDNKKEEKPPVETIVVQGFKPLGSSTVPTSREEIKRQLGFKRK